MRIAAIEKALNITRRSSKWRRSADIPVRSNARKSDGGRKFGSGTTGGRCCGQECPRSVAFFLAACEQVGLLQCRHRLRGSEAKFLTNFFGLLYQPFLNPISDLLSHSR